MTTAHLSSAARAERQAHDARMPFVDFNRSPFTIAWEITRACALACQHCRAEAQPRRDPRELTTAECFTLIDQIKEFGNPILIITGGDPMMRRDLYDILAYGTKHGLRVALSPSATRLVTRDALVRVREAGVRRVSLSLDGHTAEIHDAFRGIRGCWERTLRCVEDLRAAGLGLQINSTVSRHNVGHLDELAEMVARLDPVQWSLFFLVPTGRAQVSDVISAEQHEAVFNWFYDLSKRSSFDVKATAAQPYRRIAIQRECTAQGKTAGGAPVALAGAGYRYEDGLNRPVQGVNDGKGFMFISHVGEVCPSGFLPLVGGNVRERSVVEIYREAPAFRELRDPALLKGKCGRCEFKLVCGGSRARAYALTGDYLASDPTCVYAPVGE